MTTAELAIKFDDLRKVVSDFILEQKHVNEQVTDIATRVRGNGKDGIETVLVKLDGRVVLLEKNDLRRQKLVDALTAGMGLTLLLEIVRLVFGV